MTGDSVKINPSFIQTDWQHSHHVTGESSVILELNCGDNVLGISNVGKFRETQKAKAASQMDLFGIFSLHYSQIN